MTSSGMLRRVALVRRDVSGELSSSISVTRIGELGTTLAVTSNRRALRTRESMQAYKQVGDVINRVSFLIKMEAEWRVTPCSTCVGC
jgi:hypothetical protein